MAKQIRKEYFINCDNLVEYVAMTNAADDSAVTTATVTAALHDASDDSELVAATAMEHVAAGLYQGAIDKAAPDPALTRGQKLYLKIVASASGLDDERRIDCVAVYRGDE
ncbi:MAG: hypothetical protein KDA63_09330 [Planctomycetales bacterium]|nr:hypothetical protein [Planctomycetales bacterium]